MSSGNVTEEWQHWWQEEFLNARQAWMLIGTNWIPCSIIPEDETDGIDLTEDKMPEVLFTAKLNIEGI